MLTTNLKLAEKYNYLDPKFKKAFEFLRTADLAALPLGNTPIDGDEVFANVQAYTTRRSRATRNILTCSSSSPARNASATRRAISASPQWLTMLTATLCSMRNPPRAAASS